MAESDLGARQGPAARVQRGLLRVSSTAYGATVYLRNLYYDLVPGAVRQVDVPVISIGNLTTGGTGKTPLVAWLTRWYRERDTHVTLISRGYGAAGGGKNDEALELEIQFPDVPHILNPDRVAAAKAAARRDAGQVIVLDDAFQHRRIHRDLDVVLLDALVPFGYGHLLPRGLLREPLSALKRARVIGLSRADLVGREVREAIRTEVRRRAPGAIWVEVANRPRSLVGTSGTSLDVESLRGKPVAAFCGVGNPAGFRGTLEKHGARVVAFREYPDHHAYSSRNLEELADWAKSLPIELVLCTMKDFVKLRVERLGRHVLRALAVDAELLEGRDEFESLLRSFVARRAS